MKNLKLKSSTARHAISTAGRRRPPTSQFKTLNCSRQPRRIPGESVSEKLRALQSLIPTRTSELNADELFRDTADYILLLKTQVSVLQGLIHIYGSVKSAEGEASSCC